MPSLCALCRDELDHDVPFGAGNDLVVRRSRSTHGPFVLGSAGEDVTYEQSGGIHPSVGKYFDVGFGGADHPDAAIAQILKDDFLYEQV